MGSVAILTKWHVDYAVEVKQCANFYVSAAGTDIEHSIKLIGFRK